MCTTSRSSRIRAAAAVALDPVRARLLGELAEPASAASLAARLGIPRQKVNYHLRTLEAHGLVVLAGERRPRRHHRAPPAGDGGELRRVAGCAERGRRGPEAAADRLSARYLVALAGRVVREVGSLARRAAAAGKRLPTMSIDTEIRFRNAADRAAFADELTAAVIELAARYHHDDGRPHRLVVAAYPKPKEHTIMSTPNVPAPFRVQRRAPRQRPSRCGRRSPPGPG